MKRMSQKYGKSFPRCTNMEERKVWKTGKGSYVTALPTQWAKPILKSKERKILISEVLCNSVPCLLLTPKESYKSRKLTLEMENGDPDKLLYDIIAAYLKDYDEVYIKFGGEKPQPECVEILNSIPSKLSGVTVRSYRNGFKITMSTNPESINSLLDDMFALYEDLFNINYRVMKRIMESTFDEEGMKKQREVVEMKERDIYAYSSLIKRLLNRVLYAPWLSKDLGIDDFANIIPYTTLNVSLERLGDLQVEIFETLCILTKEEHVSYYIHSDLKGYGYIDYYAKTHRMVRDAYESRDDPSKLFWIITTKNKRKVLKKENVVLRYPLRELKMYVTREIPYRPGYVEAEEREMIYDMIKESGKEQLVYLEHQIWKMTENAVDIAEAWLNVKG